MREAYTIERGEGPLVAVALHHGHELRPEVARHIAVDEEVRLREEDPFTGRWTRLADTRVVVHRSRFEVDLNRPRSKAVYGGPDDAWGIDVWGGRPSPVVTERSLALYDRFYTELETLLERIVAREGGFVVYDLHSYNHHRDGPDAPPADPAENPELNLGTGALDRDRWSPVVEAFLESAARPLGGAPGLDVRENVRFRGGHLSHWVAERFGEHGCALAIEIKKTFMDEWTGEPDPTAIDDIGRRLARTTGPVLEALDPALGVRAS